MNLKKSDFLLKLFRKKNKADEKVRKEAVFRREKKTALTLSGLRSTHLHKSDGNVNAETEEEEKTRLSRIGFDPDYFMAALSRIGVGLLALTVVFWSVYQLISMFSSSVTLSAVYTITETEESKGKAYIIRDEEPVYIPFEGYPDFVVEDGARVAKGETVINLYSSDKSSIRSKINGLEKETAILLKSIGTGVSDAGLTESFTQVSDTYSSLMSALASGDLDGAASMSDLFREKLSRKAYLSGVAYGMSNRLIELENEKEKLMNSFGNAAAVISSSVQGYFYGFTDGYETGLSTEILKDFSVQTAEKLHAAEDAAENYTGDGKAIAKICPSAEWYLAVECTDRYMADATIDKDYSISFSESGEEDFQMTLKQKVYTDEGMLLLFRSDRQCDALCGERVQNVRIKAAEYTGYRIPESALHVCDGITGVYTLDGRFVYFRRIEIIKDGTGYCIAKVYGEAEKGAPKQYRIPAFSELDCIDSYGTLRDFATETGISPKRRDWTLKSVGYILTQIYTDPGIAVKYGQKYKYYYCLSDSENMIISGTGLYDGKVLN